MRRRRIAQALLVTIVALTGARAVASAVPGTNAPDFVLKSVSGENLRLSEYRGRVVLLSFVASWCGECRSQLEALAELYDGQADAEFELLAVSFDTDRDRAAAMASAAKAGYPVLHDGGGEVGRLYDVSSTPLVVLIDRSGVVRDVFEGYRRGNEDQYLERIRELLNE